MQATLARLTRLVIDLPHESDARLLDRFLAGSEPAFRELVIRHGPLVLGICTRILRHRQDAEDAFQAVFLVLARRAADVWPRDAVGAWLYGVAYRIAQKARAVRARRTGRERLLQDVAQFERERCEPDTAEIIDRVVRKMPEIYRAAVVACDLEGLSRKDAAGQLGWSEGTLSGRLARARRLLADRLRKAGVTLPAGGLAAVLGTNASVRAELAETVIGLGTEMVGVPTSVATLVEGAVQTMFISKLKTAIIAMLAVCAMGYGAWAGVGEGGGTPQASNGTQAPRKLARNDSTDRSAMEVPTALVPLQGRWRIVSLSDDSSKPEKPVAKERSAKPPIGMEGAEVITIRGSILSMPYQETGGVRKSMDYRIAVDDTQQPKTINLIASGLPVGRGIYEFTAPATTCASCHDAHSSGAGPLGLKPPSNVIGLCGPGLKMLESQNKMPGLRLAFALEGGRPTTFGGKGKIVFNLERIASNSEQKPANDVDRELRQLEAFLKLYDAPEERKQIEQLRARFRLLKARQEEDQARAMLSRAQAGLEQAQATVELAKIDLERAQIAYKEAQAALATAGKNSAKKLTRVNRSTKATCTIHIRPLTAGETARWVMTEECKTVLEGLALAASELPLKSGSVDIWLVRGQEILPVDFDAITGKIDLKTNYTLQAGDKLFIQAKVGR